MSLKPEKFPIQKRPLVEAILIHESTIKFSKAIGVSRQVVHGWLYKCKISPPPRYCKRIEESTSGQITREQLRPDVFGESDNKNLSDLEKLTASITLLEGVKNTLINLQKGQK